jgi:glycosyltransferase involved in cell wall biosynthesis
MACGIPIIASGEGEMCDIVEQAEAGLCAQTGDPDALADCIEEFASLDDDHICQMQINALQYYKKNFNKETLMNRMDEIINLTITEAKAG